MQIVKQSRGSLAATNELPNSIAQWQGEFATKIGTLLQQLQLPWTVQVSQLAKVLAHMAENTTASSEEDIKKIKNSSDNDDMRSTIKRRKTREYDEGNKNAKTTKGQWS